MRKNLNTPIVIVDGKEFINNGKSGWHNRLCRLYTLDDGTKITVSQLVNKIGSGCTNTCARARLKIYTDPKILYRPVRESVTKQRMSGRFKSKKDMLNPQDWYLDPLVKLMLK